jgi:ssDNA thymidine ADP-ribosyltransferase, DarT
VPPPERPKIYHIIHVDRLPSVLAAGCLWCDAEMVNRPETGTVIGMNEIKQRRLAELTLSSHPGLYVGQCVPFYFCPRSVMLYLIWQRNHANLSYRGGEGPIVHLEADLQDSVQWADGVGHRWAFTLSNAGARYFEDRSSLDVLHEINWDAVAANNWSGRGVQSSVKDGKQAEFLVEGQFPWELVERIGVRSLDIAQQVSAVLTARAHRPPVEIRKDWYYGG